jgi:hypothetical protein
MERNFFLATLDKSQVIVILAKLNPVEMFSIVSQSKADRQYVDENDVWKEVAEVRYARNEDFDRYITPLKEKREWELTPAVPKTQSLNYFRAMLADYLLEERSFNGKAYFSERKYEGNPVVFAYMESDDKRPVELFSVTYKVEHLGNGRRSSTLVVEILDTKNMGEYRKPYTALMNVLKSQIKFKAPNTREIPETMRLLLENELFESLNQVRGIFYRILNIEGVYFSMNNDVFLKNKLDGGC